MLPCDGPEPAPGTKAIKDIIDIDKVAAAVGALLTRNDGVWLESDMRAHRNPKRMRAIASSVLADPSVCDVCNP